MDLLCSVTVLSTSRSLFPQTSSSCPMRSAPHPPACSVPREAALYAVYHQVPCLWLRALADGGHWQKISGHKKIRSRTYSPGSASGHHSPTASSMGACSSCQTPILMAAFSGLPYLFPSFTPSGWRWWQLPTVANPKVLLYPLLVSLNPPSLSRPSLSYRILTV